MSLHSTRTQTANDLVKKVEDKEILQSGTGIRLRQPSLSFQLALSRARLDKKWNQKQLANAAAIHLQDVKDFESGSRVPSGPVVDKFNRLLGVTLPKIEKVIKG